MNFIDDVLVKIPTDAVIWAGIGVVGVVLLLAILKLCLRTKLSHYPYRYDISCILVWTYFAFAALYVWGTLNTTMLAYPIAVVVLSHFIMWLFERLCRPEIHCVCVPCSLEPKPRKQKVKKEKNKTRKKKEEKGVEEMKIIATDKKGKPVEVTLPDIEPMYRSSAASKGGLSGDSLERETERKLERIMEKDKEIDRRREKNVKITDGAKENKFMSGLDVKDTLASPHDPKVVVRKVTEQVEIKPKTEEAPKTGFTYQKIVERREVENKSSAGSHNVFQSRNISATSASSAAHTKTATQSAQDVLDAIARLRSSMNDKK